MSRVVIAAFAACLTLVLGVATASAHVTVWPRETAPGAFERYTVRVPTEKEIPTVALRVTIPEGLRVVSVQPKPGWTYELEKDASGNIIGISWSGGSIGPSEFDEFAFVAANPREPGELVFAADQTYSDGSVVSWDGPADADTPASIVTIGVSTGAAGQPVDDHGAPVSSETTTDGGITTAAVTSNASSSDAPLGATGTFWISVAALVMSVIAAGLSLMRLRQPRA